jgi:hypothetical protein
MFRVKKRRFSTCIQLCDKVKLKPARVIADYNSKVRVIRHVKQNHYINKVTESLIFWGSIV